MEKYTTFEELVEAAFDEFFDSMDTGCKVSFWNEYCDDCNMYDSHIYFMYELDDIFCCTKPTELLEKFNFRSFNINHDYFMDGVYGISSTDYPDEEIEESEIEEWFTRNGENSNFYDDFMKFCEDNEYSLVDDDDEDE